MATLRAQLEQAIVDLIPITMGSKMSAVTTVMPRGTAGCVDRPQVITDTNSPSERPPVYQG